ncbi:DUF6622 family protein [uncultured Sphingomonas sp.]|uniref:DUF6622 family protein n=1 Tax=uncultured Sphingomonas sp. TaxID=158754 RepID=UPI0025D86FB8|nr:DUF6622 family protein [uncultured Sphingomonas sp.]
MHASNIATGAPAWVYALLVGLVVLGVRRLRTRDVPVAVAVIPSIAFLVWSLFGVAAFAQHVGLISAVAAWIAGAVIGGASGQVLPDPRGQQLAGGRVRQPGSPVPLILYLGVFAAKFACGAWAAIVPASANTATTIGIAIGAAMTARLIVGILRWTAPPPDYSAA